MRDQTLPSGLVHQARPIPRGVYNVRVLIADDHRLVSDTFAEYLKAHNPNAFVQQAETLEEALEWIGRHGPIDLVLLDMKMQGMNGLDGLKRFQEHFPDLPVVIFSGFGDHEVVSRALELGAAGFVPKQMSAPAVIKALELVLTGETYVPSRFIPGSRPKRGTPEGDARHRHPMASWGAGNPLNRISPREAEVLALLTKGFSNKEIARDLGISEATAAFHVRRLCQKLDASNRTQVVTRALKFGWRER